MLALACHPESPRGPVRSVSAQASRESEGSLALRYVIEGDLRRVRIPPPAPPRLVEGLWRHTCCEVFFGPLDSADYQECNFSPSGEWACFAFSAYRAGRSREAGKPPQIRVERSDEQVALWARAPVRVTGRLRVGLSVVIEDERGLLSYWALRHPAGQPDFHHRDAFALELA